MAPRANVRPLTIRSANSCKQEGQPCRLPSRTCAARILDSKLGLAVAASTVSEILRAAGIDPAPRRDGPTGRQFLHAQAAGIPAVEWAAVTKRRSASSGLLPRDQMRAWMSAAKAVGCVPVGVFGWAG
jgi:hypothetical protein